MPLLFGVNQSVAQLVQSQSAQNAPTKQPYWDVPGFNPPATAPQGQVNDPNWEAPVQFWSEWDTAFVATNDGKLRVPGLVTVTCRRAHRVQMKTTAGAHGGNGTLLGFEPAEVDMVCQMWTSAQFQQWETLVASIQKQLNFVMNGPAIPTDKTNPRKVGAFDVYHPGLAALRVSSLFFLHFTIPRRTSTAQVYETTFKWQEFNPIKQAAAPVTVLGASGDLSSSTPSVYGLPAKPASPNQSGASGP